MVRPRGGGNTSHGWIKLGNTPGCLSSGSSSSITVDGNEYHLAAFDAQLAIDHMGPLLEVFRTLNKEFTDRNVDAIANASDYTTNSLVITTGGEPVAVCILVEQPGLTLYMPYFAVLPSLQQTGLGSWLLFQVLVKAHANRFGWLFWDTPATFADAMPFYENIGAQKKEVRNADGQVVHYRYHLQVDIGLEHLRA